MKKNLMIRYVFETNPTGLQKIISKYGIAPAVSPQDLWKKTNYIVMKFPQDALRDIVSVHPDRAIIVKLSGAAQGSNAPSNHITAESPISKEAIEKLQVSDKKSSCNATSGCSGATSGCSGETSGCDGCKHNKSSNAEGDAKTETAVTEASKTATPATTAVVPAATTATTEHKSSFKEHLPLLAVSALAIGGLLYLLNKRG
jgi:hypothetical protein